METMMSRFNTFLISGCEPTREHQPTQELIAELLREEQPDVGSGLCSRGLAPTRLPVDVAGDADAPFPAAPADRGVATSC
jgi:hypothetical protein